jgi:hypothetical protein
MANEKEEMGLDRREFLKTAGFAGVGLAGILAGFLSGCATTEPPKPDIAASLSAIKPEPVVYPKLPYNKVQAPEDGCFVGFRKVYALSMPDVYKKEWGNLTRASDSIDDIAKAFNDPKWDNTLSKVIGDNVEYYGKALGKNPGIFVLYETPKLFLDFPANQVAEVAKKGVIPYLNFLPWWEQKKSIRLDLKDIAKGKHDKSLKNLAEGAAQFGQKHGGFFTTTMEEMNGYWYPWGQSSNFIPAWRHIWQVFEDQGANRYATWVWEPFCLEPSRQFDITKMQEPERYYPGDKYVDWIGFSAFSRKGWHGDGMLFGHLIGKSYPEMRKNHPDKPIMQAETGKTQLWDQPRWLIDAYKTVKEMPGLKAVIYWDNITPSVSDDKTLSDKSLATMKEIFKDPYWIMAK